MKFNCNLMMTIIKLLNEFWKLYYSFIPKREHIIDQSVVKVVKVVKV